MQYPLFKNHSKKLTALITLAVLSLLAVRDSTTPWGLQTAIADSIDSDAQSDEGQLQSSLREAEVLTKNTLRKIRHLETLDATSKQIIVEDTARLQGLIEKNKPLVEQEVLNLLKSSQEVSRSLTDTRAEALSVLNRYLNTLLNLYQVLLSQNGSPKEIIEKLYLELPKPALRLFAFSNSTENFSLISVQNSDKIKIGPSNEILLGIEASEAQYSEGKNTLIPLTQYLILRQLFQNLGHTRKLLLSYEDSFPKIPNTLLQQFPSLKASRSLLSDPSDSRTEFHFRKKIIVELKRVRFFTVSAPTLSELVQDLTNLIERDRSKKKALTKRILVRTSSALNHRLMEHFENELLASEIQFSLLDEVSIRKELNEILTGSASTLILQELLHSFKDEKITPPIAVRVQLLNRVDQYRSRISQEGTLKHISVPFETLLHSSKIAEKLAYRSQFISQLLNEISDDLQDDQEFIYSTPVNLYTLFSSQSSNWSNLSPSDETLSRVGKILSSPDWKSAQAALRENLESLRQKKTPALRLSHTQITAHLNEKIRENQSASIEFLKAFSQQMHFDENITPSSTFPTLRELNLTPTEIRNYREKLRHEMAERYPLLTLKVGSRGKCLDSELRGLFSDRFESPEIEQKAVSFIEEALHKSETETLRSIQKVIHSENKDELAVLAQSAAINGLIAETFPARAKEIHFQLQNFKHSGLVDHFIHQTIGNYLSYGFTALLVAHGTGWLFKGAKPWVQALTYGLDPFIKGYIKSAVPLIFIDTVYQYRDLNQKNQSLELAKSTFRSLPRTQNPLTLSQLQELQKQYNLEEFFFWGRVSMDVFFMYIPEAQEFLRPLPVSGGF